MLRRVRRQRPTSLVWALAVLALALCLLAAPSAAAKGMKKPRSRAGSRDAEERQEPAAALDQQPEPTTTTTPTPTRGLLVPYLAPADLAALAVTSHARYSAAVDDLEARQFRAYYIELLGTRAWQRDFDGSAAPPRDARVEAFARVLRFYALGQPQSVVSRGATFGELNYSSAAVLVLQHTTILGLLGTTGDGNGGDDDEIQLDHETPALSQAARELVEGLVEIETRFTEKNKFVRFDEVSRKIIDRVIVFLDTKFTPGADRRTADDLQDFQRGDVVYYYFLWWRASSGSSKLNLPFLAVAKYIVGDADKATIERLVQALWVARTAFNTLSAAARTRFWAVGRDPIEDIRRVFAAL